MGSNGYVRRLNVLQEHIYDQRRARMAAAAGVDVAEVAEEEVRIQGLLDQLGPRATLELLAAEAGVSVEELEETARQITQEGDE